jgi:hypothetical protein
MYRSALCIALLGSISLSAQAFSVESMTLTGGSLNITDPSGNSISGPLSLAPGAAATVTDGTINGVIDADGHHGSVSNPVLTTDLLGITVFGYFAHSAATPDTNATMITIHDPDPDAISMSGTPWDYLISADFSGFFVDFNGNKILQGGTATGTGNWIVIPTVEGGQGVFDFALSWSAYNAQGPFLGLTGNWTLTGTAVTAVPEANTYALMLAGLGLVGFAARRRQAGGA